MKILWIGNIASEDGMLRAIAASPAANRWQSGLLRGLLDHGCEVRILGHQPDRLWPRGAPYVSGSDADATLLGTSSTVPQTLVRYVNLPGYRRRDLTRKYSSAFERLVSGGFRPDIVISYNVYDHSVAVSEIAREKGIRWVPIVADIPEERRKQALHMRRLRSAAGCVFLSWDAYSRWGANPKFHFDGGVLTAPEAEIDVPIKGKPKVIFYCGTLGKYGGVDLLLDAFTRIREPNVRLWICGKGTNARLAAAATRDSRIAVFGAVSEARLKELSRESWVMVNPRPPGVPGNENNFPSKVLEYLSYGKPVVSTLTPGLAPDYSDILVIADPYTSETLAEKINDVLHENHSLRQDRVRKISRFLRMEKTWDVQARNLLDWVSCLMNDKCRQAESPIS